MGVFRGNFTGSNPQMNVYCFKKAGLILLENTTKFNANPLRNVKTPRNFSPVCSRPTASIIYERGVDITVGH